MKLFLCGNTGCENRGCEAIIRSTVKLLGKSRGDIYLCTWQEQQDSWVAKELGLTLLTYDKYPSTWIRYVLGGLRKAFGWYMYSERLFQRRLFSRIGEEDICLNIGGDTYCYDTPYTSLALNRYAQKAGAKCILWCHSIEDAVIARPAIKKDLMRYYKIFARDCLTVECLKKNGIPDEKIVKVCDPAFFLDIRETALPANFLPGNTVGINISTGVIKDSHPQVYVNVLNMAKDILENTNMNICLIPHVYSVSHNRGDYVVLQRLQGDLNSPRVSVIDRDISCEELKYVISKCRFLVAARTHASIAAYSTGVPTIVLGYSIKSRGIAKDLFGSEKGYVLPYENIQGDSELLDAFHALMEREDEIKHLYKEILPAYKQTLLDAIENLIPKESFDCIHICSRELCSGCGACAAACPFDCISMQQDREGFLYPVIDMELCKRCGKCQRICPVRENPGDDGQCPEAYAAQAKSNDLRQNSSSGGLFSLMAEKVIARGGVVFGCALDASMNAYHVACETVDELKKLRGSKYVQSNVKDTFRQAKEYLDSGRTVLYSGTPCQIAGLYAFLGKSYDNLYTQDLICHGVPSPGLWAKYVQYREKTAGSRTENVSFRDKVSGWRSFSLTFRFCNQKEYCGNVTQEPWMRFFLNGLSTRKSCDVCSFRHIHRQSDVTLADFWGVRHILPKWDDDKGTSLVLIQSEKGKQLWQSVQAEISCCSVNMEDVLRYSPSYIKSSPENPLRARFLSDSASMPIDQLTAKYTGNRLAAKMLRKASKYRVSETEVK